MKKNFEVLELLPSGRTTSRGRFATKETADHYCHSLNIDYNEENHHYVAPTVIQPGEMDATELTVGDVFRQIGGTRAYKVIEVMDAHRDEYAQVVRVQTHRGTQATVAFPADSSVILESRIS